MTGRDDQPRMRRIYKNTKIRFSDFTDVGKYFSEEGSPTVRPRDAYEITKWVADVLRYRRGGMLRKRMPSITCRKLHQEFLEANPQFSEEARFLSFFYFLPEVLEVLGFKVDSDTGVIELWD